MYKTVRFLEAMCMCGYPLESSRQIFSSFNSTKGSAKPESKVIFDSKSSIPHNKECFDLETKFVKGS